MLLLADFLYDDVSDKFINCSNTGLVLLNGGLTHNFDQQDLSFFLLEILFNVAAIHCNGTHRPQRQYKKATVGFRLQ